jgi:hypothetical protein
MHSAPLHSIAAGALQAPCPSHTAAGMNLPSPHEAALQITVLPAF